MSDLVGYVGRDGVLYVERRDQLSHNDSVDAMQRQWETMCDVLMKMGILPSEYFDTVGQSEHDLDRSTRLRRVLRSVRSLGGRALAGPRYLRQAWSTPHVTWPSSHWFPQRGDTEPRRQAGIGKCRRGSGAHVRRSKGARVASHNKEG